jgi:chromosome segregation ATPase
MAEQRACECEATLKEATAQMRSLTCRNTALEAQFRAKESEVEELQGAMTDSRKRSSEIEFRGVQLQADLRGACADIANLTAQLGVQTAIAHSRDVEIEELKSAVRAAGFRQEAAGDALDDTVGENRRLALQCAQLQCSLKTQVNYSQTHLENH